MGRCHSQTAGEKRRNFSLKPSITLSKALLMNVQLPCRYYHQEALLNNIITGNINISSINLLMAKYHIHMTYIRPQVI